MTDYPIDYLTELREQKDDEFKNSMQSPLTPEQRQLFSGLSYFEPKPALEFIAKPEEFADKPEVRFITTQNEIKHFQRWGQMQFTVDGVALTLTLYSSQNSALFFVPFTDMTTGNETYSAGRYIEPEPQTDGTIRLDFNEAYNPYCAYNEPDYLAAQAQRTPRIWNCALPLPENRLSVAIDAGERMPEGAWVRAEH